MKFYRDPATGMVFAYESDGSQDDVIGEGQLRMTAAEVARHLNPQPTRDQVEANERSWRDGEVASLLWLRERHRDQVEMGRATALTGDQFAELLDYLQSLRDWPQSEQFPDAGHRPTVPEWIAGQEQ